MRKLSVLLALLLFAGMQAVFAQRTITGTVTSAEDSNPIPGVAITVKGTTQGVTTDIDGKYTLVVKEDAQTLVYRFVGMKTKEVAIGSSNVIDVILEPEMLDIEGVVITALGIKRETKALGYSVQDVKGEDLAKSNEANVINSLQGRVSGAQITSSSGAVGASSRIVLRGVSSLDGNNQPLFVIDGVPIDNSSFGNTGTGGTNRGNGAGDINPDDVESMTVLKGPNASALYGSRASNGVIVITTKKGTKRKGIGVSVNNTTSFESPLRLPDWQNDYGQGSHGNFNFVDGKGGGTNDGTDESWGPRLDAGLEIPQFFSADENGEYQPAPWVSNPDNVKNFFETGQTVTTNVSINGGNEDANFRLSYTQMDQKGMVPNTEYGKKTLSWNASANASEKLTFSTSGSYVNAESENMPGYGYNANNVMQQFIWFGRQVDLERLKDKQWNDDGSIYNWNYNYHNNPYATLNENLQPLRRDRFFGNAMAKYQFNDNLSAFFRSGGDVYSHFESDRKFVGDQDFKQGFYSETATTFREINTDFLVSYNKTFGDDLDFGINFGGNRLDVVTQRNFGSAPELAIAGVYNVANSSVTPVATNRYTKKRINSLYAFGQFGYKSMLYLDYSFRNDWSSTLPADENSYFYPGVTASAILTDIFGIESNAMTFAKFRAGWARVGGDTDPYRLQPTVGFGGGWNASTKLLNLNVPNTLPNALLKPQQTESFEAGMDFRFFLDRVRLDVTYYQSKSYNQIVDVPVSAASGFLFKKINAGQINNSGIEALLSITPIKTNDFEWDLTFNFSKNNNEVVELSEDIERYELGGYWSLDVMAIPGQSYGSLYGYDFERDPNGNIIYTDGLPSQGELKELGNFTPDWIGGMMNEFKYKGFNLSCLIDMRQGSDLYSMTTTWGRYAGVLEETLIGREGGIVGDGVKPDGNGGFVTNDVVVDAESFNKAAYSNDIAFSSVFDASYIKLREVKFGYTFKNSPKFPLRDLNVSFIGRNLAILHSTVPHIDPETAFSNGNVQGLEFGQLPSAKSIGFSIGCKF